MNENTKKDLQSAAFERLLNHLRERNDVQNIDLMNLLDFVGIVYLNGIVRKQKKDRDFDPAQESMFMVCPTLIGKKYQK